MWRERSNEALLPAAWALEAAGSLRSPAAIMIGRRSRTPRRYPDNTTTLSPLLPGPAMRLLHLGILTLSVVLGCAAGSESPSQAAARLARESAAAKVVIDSLNSAYLHPSAGVVAQYAEDAEVVAGPLELKGRTAIANGMTDGASVGGTMRMHAVSVTAYGPLAIERGVYTMTITPPGAPQALSEDGNYLIHWRLADGHWLRAAEFASSPHPLPPPPPPPRE
jgi:ketosteroid isomerase-like protein